MHRRQVHVATYVALGGPSPFRIPDLTGLKIQRQDPDIKLRMSALYMEKPVATMQYLQADYQFVLS